MLFAAAALGAFASPAVAATATGAAAAQSVAVGFGGSMIWFGSSAGVALSNMYPGAKSVGRWLRHGWPVAVAYVFGFFVMLAVLEWNPDAPHKKRVELPSTLVTLGSTS